MTRISIIKIRLSHDRRIFIMGIHTLKDGLYIEIGLLLGRHAPMSILLSDLLITWFNWYYRMDE